MPNELHAELRYHAPGPRTAGRHLQKIRALNPFGSGPPGPHSHAREETRACLGTRRPAHTPAMTGSPMRRLRQSGALDPDTGEVIVIPRLPRVAGASKPPGWDRWPAAEKAEHLLGLSLDRMRDYLSWPPDDLDPHRLAAQVQVIRVVAMVAAKVGERRPDPEVAERFRRAMERAARDEGAAERFRQAMARTAALDKASLYGENRAGRGGCLEKSGRPRKLRPVFRDFVPPLKSPPSLHKAATMRKRPRNARRSAVVRLLTTDFAVAGYSAAVEAPAFLPALTSLYTLGRRAFTADPSFLPLLA